MSRLKVFPGFPPGKINFTSIPDVFFTDLMPLVDDLDEMKIILYLIWLLDHRDGKIRFVRHSEIIQDQAFMKCLEGDTDPADQRLEAGLQKAESQGAILTIHPEGDNDPCFFLNTSRSQAVVESFHAGKWHPKEIHFVPGGLDVLKPNVFKLYEQNIGPLTPMIADLLKSAEKDFPPEWIDEAFRIAVINNVRKWNYIHAILRSWQERGRDDENRRDPQKDYRRYLEGEYARFIEH